MMRGARPRRVSSSSTGDKPDQHRDAIAEQHHVALARAEGERHGVDHVAAFKSERVDPLAEHSARAVSRVRRQRL